MIKIIVLMMVLTSGAFASEDNREFVIFHTNDLHGFVENSVTDPEVGGFARLKATLNQQKALIAQQGLESLFLDAGDFMEGSLFYMVNKGRDLFKAMGSLGYDAVVMGNHDWLMGAKELNKLLEENPPRFHYLGANVDVNRHLYDGFKEVKPYTIFYKAGIKIAIVGLTTDEVFYSWALKNGKIKNPYKVAKKLVKKIKKKERPDVIIALTHMGVDAEVELAKKVSDIDLVIGGHSHSALHEPIYVGHKKIPVVQAGDHGYFLGKITLGVSEDNKLSVKQYGLIPLSQEIEDESVKQSVEKLREGVNELYGPEYLNEVLAISKIDIINSEDMMTVWNGVVADAMKEAVAADMSVHSAGFAGVNLRPGPITREQMFHTYPRFFSLNNKWGWYVYKVSVRGFLIKLVLNGILSSNRGLTFSGITFDIKEKNGKKKAKNIRVGGKKLKYFDVYTVSLPEGIVKGGFGITPLVGHLLRLSGRIETTIWQAIEKKVKQLRVIDENTGRQIYDRTSGTAQTRQDFKARRHAHPIQFVPAGKGVKTRR